MGVAPVLIIALMVGGQSPAKPPAVPGPTLHIMYDDSAKGWTSPDAAALLKWVAERNKQLKISKAATKPKEAPADPAGPKGGADKDHPPSGKGHPPAVRNYGVDFSKIPKVRNDRRWGSPGAFDDEQMATLAQKKGRVHVTAIGPGADTIVDAWRADPQFAAMEQMLGDRLAVQAFPDPSNPLVADVGLPAGGKPDVVIQDDTGRVIYRARADPGPAVIVGEVRRRDPTYDPTRDPSSSLGMDAGRVVFWGAVAVGAFLVFKGRSR
jgi:hypothetical protein